MNIIKTVPLVFNGENVLTGKQLAELLDCTTYTIKSCLYYHRKEFVEGVDFFNLKGGKLRRFKAQVSESKNSNSPESKNSNSPESKNSNSPESKNSNSPFSMNATCLQVWTKSGALKLSKHIDTDKAKAVYISIALGYYPAHSNEQPKEELNSSLPQLATQNLNPQLSQLDKLEFLNEFIKNCAIITDPDLRDSLIKRAAHILFNN